MPKSKPSSHAAILRRLAPLYAASFLNGFVLWYAIEKLFMREIGYNDTGIGVMVAAYSTLMLVMETPSGILADRWSRKGVLILASLALALSSFVGGISTEPLLYIVSALLWGTFYAFYSGTYDSIVYDVVVEETGKGDQFAKYFGYVHVLDSVALATGAVLGGVMAGWFGMRSTYFWTVALSLLAIVCLWRFKEPLLHKADAVSNIKEHIATTFKAVLGNRSLWVLLVVMVAVQLIADIMYEFSQLWLIAVATPVVLFGPAFAAVLATGGTGGYVASLTKWRKVVTPLCFAGIGVSGLGLTFVHEIWGIVALLVLLGTSVNALGILLLNDLHDHLPSQVRAGASSAVSTMGRMALIPTALLFGWLSTTYSVFVAAWIIVGLMVVAVVFEFWPRKMAVEQNS